MLDSKPGEWVLLISSAPGLQPIAVGVLLLDCVTNQIHTKCRPSWWSLCACDEDVDLVHAFIADLEQESLTIGGKQLLAWLEDTASHALQVSDRYPVQIDSVSQTLHRLYEQYIGESETQRSDSDFVSSPEAFLRSQPRRWHQVGSFAAAALLFLTIGPSLSTGPVLSQPTSAISIGSDALELPMASAPQREISLDGYIDPVNAQSAPKKRTRSPHHRRFSTPPVAVRPRYVQLAVLMPAKIAVPSDTLAPAFVPPPALDPPPFRSRRGALARMVSAVGTPFKALVRH